MAAASETPENSEEKVQENSIESETNSSDNNKVKLEDLKVVDLKNELEKRDLDKSGIKAVLVERLKTAIIEEGENPDDINFEISDSNESPVDKNLTESVEENGDVDETDKLVLQEEKIDVTLQLSIDEEEAQLNEEESLMDIPKISDDKTDCITETTSDLPEKENNSNIEENSEKETSPIKTIKIANDESKTKKVSKSALQSKTIALSSVTSPKVVKVINKSDKPKGTNITGAKCLWVTGIPDTTRAADLKTLFSKQGRVLAVKIVKNAKQTPSRCYGFVTMATSKDATKAIQNLHRTELNGRLISVERTQNEPSTLLKKAESKLLAKKPSIRKEVLTPKKAVSASNEAKSDSKEPAKEVKTADSNKTTVEETTKKKDEKTSIADKDKPKDKERDRKSRERRERDTRRPVRRPAGFKPRVFNYGERSSYGTFRRPFNRRPFPSRIGFGSNFKPRSSLLMQKLRDERYQSERIRKRREAEHRRADEISRHRYIERKQREEAYRLEREKEKLRIERELLERERAEILKLEREKQRLERERIEREREELRRQAELRRSAKRSFSRIDREPDHIWNERKKSSRFDGRFSFHAEPSSSSRYEYPTRDRASYNREYERHSERISTPKHLDTLPRTEYGDHDARREVTIRGRDERHVFSRNDFKGRDNRRSFPSRERHSSARREATRDDWKHDRRVHERIISPSSASGHRRMAYY